MCGIAGIHVKKPGLIKSHEGLETFVNHLLLGIEKRGPHSTGFVATTFGQNRKTVMDKAPTTASDFIKTRDKLPDNLQTVLLHTRYATKGGPEDHRNNHPVLHKTCFAVHNGHINNDDKLFEKYSLDRFGEVDSEVIAAMAYKIGLDDPQEWLSKLEGYMATAVIDPVNFPGRLVLAKGKWSPLVSFENDRFIVWASEMQAIKEAWGHVMGTPPKYNKFHHWKDGELWVYDDAKKEETTFQVASYVKTVKPSGKAVGYGAPPVGEPEPEARVAPHWFRNGKAQEAPKEPEKNPLADMDENEKRTLAVRAIVRAARSQGKDWIECVPMNAMTEATREELYEKYPELNGSLKWVTCHSCDTFVAAPQFQDTLNWGTICLDCREANIQYYQRKAQLAADAEAEDESAVVEWIDKPTLAKLVEFIDVEVELHNEALVALSDEVDIDPAILDWLIFRAPDSYFNDHPILADVAQEFDAMYQEFMETLWEEKNTSPEPRREAHLDYCAEHGQYMNKGANCQDCELDSQWAAHREQNQAAKAFPTVGGVGIEGTLASPVTEMKVCKCGKFSTSGCCITCRNKQENEELNPTTPPVRPALNPGPAPVGVPERAERQDSCVSCGAGAEFLVPNRPWSWCVDCFVECGTPVEGVPCTALCNHTDPQGVRVCHAHARGVRGVVSDKLLKEKYGDFIELGRF